MRARRAGRRSAWQRLLRGAPSSSRMAARRAGESPARRRRRPATACRRVRSRRCRCPRTNRRPGAAAASSASASTCSRGSSCDERLFARRPVPARLRPSAASSAQRPGDDRAGRDASDSVDDDARHAVGQVEQHRRVELAGDDRRRRGGAAPGASRRPRRSPRRRRRGAASPQTKIGMRGSVGPDRGTGAPGVASDLVLDRQVEEVRGAGDARVVAADHLLQPMGRLRVRQVAARRRRPSRGPPRWPPGSGASGGTIWAARCGPARRSRNGGSSIPRGASVAHAATPAAARHATSGDSGGRYASMMSSASANAWTSSTARATIEA